MTSEQEYQDALYRGRREGRELLQARLTPLINELASERKETARLLRQTVDEIRTGKIHPSHVANRLAKRAREIDPEGEGK